MSKVLSLTELLLLVLVVVLVVVGLIEVKLPEPGLLCNPALNKRARFHLRS